MLTEVLLIQFPISPVSSRSSDETVIVIERECFHHTDDSPASRHVAFAEQDECDYGYVERMHSPQLLLATPKTSPQIPIHIPHWTPDPRWGQPVYSSTSASTPAPSSSSLGELNRPWPLPPQSYHSPAWRPSPSPTGQSMNEKKALPAVPASSPQSTA